MEPTETVIATFPTHIAAERAISKLAKSSFEITSLSLIGKGYHTEEKAIGFFKIGDRIKFWGPRGAFWGGLWGLFFGGLSVTLPAIGPVMVLGYLAAAALAALEGAVVIGGLSAIGAALFSIGVPKNSIIQYEAVIKADGFLVMAHGTTEEINRARAILGEETPSAIDTHTGHQGSEMPDRLTPVPA